MDWKIIGIGALINAALTIILSWIFLPLFFLGPIAGGFIASYLSKGYEDYDEMDTKDGAVLGAISGIIGGLIIGLLLVLGASDICHHRINIYQNRININWIYYNSIISNYELYFRIIRRSIRGYS
ncbi:DUF5518 domain-containing protein [Methanobacterium sp. SMA-27]|uniref:DUF5518 domain-containing protein n=1 Tax=Methanobacterium sp. SMA-27 TaxID=1495336 RepID=UPI001E3BB706|nr:DUF5518 domain-containing protein [Methanobacterium sp. SMA-27]